MIYIVLAACIFCADLILKEYMEKTLTEGEEKKRLGGFLIFRKHHNRGAFLNAGEKRQKVVAAVSVLFTLLLTVFFVFTLGKRGKTSLKTGLALLLGGAFSNTYDRLKRKYVVDYVSFGVKWKRLSCMIFNVSDFCIMIGALVAVLSAGE